MSTQAHAFDYGTKEVMQYLFSDLLCVYNKHKVTLLVFLAQYEVDGCIVYELTCGGRPLARASFYIGGGIESDDVYKALKSEGFGRPPEKVCNHGICYHADPSNMPELCYSGPAPQLPRPVTERLNNVLSRFGSIRADGLTRHVEWLLWMNPWKAVDFDGADLKRYLKSQGFHVVQLELCSQGEEAARRRAVKRERRRFKLTAKELRSGYVKFTADGGDVVISGVTGRCRGRDVGCVERLARKIIKAPERPPPHIMEMADAVLRNVLSTASRDGTWASAGADRYIYGRDGPTLSVNISLRYDKPFYSNRGEWLAEVESCYCGRCLCGPEIRYTVKRILRLGSGDIDQRVLRRVVFTTVRQAYNAKP